MHQLQAQHIFTRPPHLSMPDRPPPSTAAIALATAILGVLAGYFFAQASSLGLFSSSSPSARASKRGNAPKKSWPNSYDVTLHPDSSDEELMKGLRADSGGGNDSSGVETEDDGTGLKAFEGYRDECKLVLVVRTDLGMQRGISIPRFFSPPSPFKINTELSRQPFSQVKSPPNAPTPLYPTTASLSPIRTSPPSSAAGSQPARPKLPFRPLFISLAMMMEGWKKGMGAGRPGSTSCEHRRGIWACVLQLCTMQDAHRSRRGVRQC